MAPKPLRNNVLQLELGAHGNLHGPLLSKLKLCSKTRSLERGKQVHAEAVEYECDSDIYVASALINMYGKCSSMVDARRVFDSMKRRNVVSWTALILGYAENGQGFTALDLFRRMKSEGVAPNSVTFMAALKACTSINGREKCRGLSRGMHNLAVENGFDSDGYLQGTLIDTYAKCGCLVEARQVFDIMKRLDVVSCTALILGYTENGEGLTALFLFTKMKAPDSGALLAALKACISLILRGASGRRKCMNWSKAIHNLAVENGYDSEIKVQNTLIDIYAKCGSMVNAHQVFNNIKHSNVVSWTVLILGYVENGKSLDALDMFRKMKSSGPPPDSVTLVAALMACTSWMEETNGRAECREQAKQIHELALVNGCFSNIHVQSTLIDIYAKCGNMVDARGVFDIIKHPNVVSWTALILGYAENGQGLAALDLFMGMKSEGPAPDSVIFAAALKVCGSFGALEFGRTLHSEIICGNYLNEVLVNCLVDFYGKCGSLVEAKTVFDLHADTRNVVTWNAFLGGFCSSRDKSYVFGLFEKMQDTNILPDGVTFLSILTFCSHAGLIEKGKECFDLMSTKYGIHPSVEHYTCMIDSFGRANKLDDAMAFLKRMPCSSNDVTWMSILAACRKWKNVEIGRLAFQSLTCFNAAAYVLMGQIYGSRSMLQEQEMVMAMRESLGKF